MPIPKDFSTPVRLTAKERVFSQLQQWIIDGTIHPGEKLTDSELANALGVSRTPVREALQLLAVQGFVEMHPGKETRVTMVDKEDVSKVIPPLAAMESLAAELATPLISEETIAFLKETNEKFAQAVHAGDSYTALTIDNQFHEAIVEVTNNPYILSIISTLQANARRLYYLKAIVPALTSIEQHNQIISAFEQRDKEKAADIMRKNFLRPLEEFYN